MQKCQLCKTSLTATTCIKTNACGHCFCPPCNSLDLSFCIICRYNLDVPLRRGEEEEEQVAWWRDHSAKLEQEMQERVREREITPRPQERAGEQEEQVRTLQQEIARLREENATRGKEITNLEVENGKVTEDFLKAKGDVTETDKKMASLEEEKTRHERNRQREEEGMKSTYEAMTLMKERAERRERLIKDMRQENTRQQDLIIKLRRDNGNYQDRVKKLEEDRVLREEKALVSEEKNALKATDNKQAEQIAHLQKDNRTYRQLNSQLQTEICAKETEVKELIERKTINYQETVNYYQREQAKQQEEMVALRRERDRYQQLNPQLQTEICAKETKVKELIERKTINYQETVNYQREQANYYQREQAKQQEEVVALRRERDRYKEDAQRFKRQEEAALKGSNEAKRIVEAAAPPPQLPQRESVAGEIAVDVDLAGVCGLPNLGNTCYINSVVQCLYHLPALRTCLAHCLREYTLNPKLWTHC